MSSQEKSKKFCVIGCGRLGTALSVFLSQNRYQPEAFASKSLASANKTADLAGAGQVVDAPVTAVKSADIVFITTPDGAIESVCKAIAAQGGFSDRHLVYHLSGALCSDILSAARDQGSAIGSIHPLQAFAPFEKGQESPFKDINISIEGDTAAVKEGQKIVSALGARSFILPTHAKTLYHASAVVASNYLVTLERFAIALLKQADLTEADAYQILKPLIMGTLNNIETNGCINALTGPVARGDDDIVRRHLSDIDQKLPQFSDLYRLLGRHTLDIAKKQAGQLSGLSEDALKKLFTP